MNTDDQETEQECEIVAEYFLLEHYDVDANGNTGDFIEAGTPSDFNNYFCMTHDYTTDLWPEMQQHQRDNAVRTKVKQEILKIN